MTAGLLTKTLLAALGFNVALASGWIDTVRPWSGTVNTALLIVLAVITRRQHHETAAELHATHADVGAAASAAASAAEAAAESARVVKAIGSTLRTEIPPVAVAAKPRRKRSVAGG